MRHKNLCIARAGFQQLVPGTGSLEQHRPCISLGEGPSNTHAASLTPAATE